MARTLTNNTSLLYSIEATPGALAGSPVWKQMEPNAITSYGATISTVARSPISKNRQRKKGTITDLDSSAEFETDLTLDCFKDFIEGFVCATFSGGVSAKPTAVTATAYTVPALATALIQNTLVFARGFVNAANNGLKVVGAAGTTTSVPITGGGLVAETPAVTRNASLEVTGFRFSSGDLQVDAQGNLTTTTKDLTTLGLTPGQSIWIGGSDSANQFAGTANKGFARVVTIATNKLTLDKKSQVFTTDTGAGKSVDIYFGRFLKNVPVDDPKFLDRSYQFELAYKDLEAVGTDAYEYSIGNVCNTAAFELPLTNKATVTFGFVGLDTPAPTATRAANAGNPLVPVETSAFNTSADIARLRINKLDETGLTTDFKSVTFTINNNRGPEKVLGKLGARFMNIGNFEIDIESQLLFTNKGVVEAVRDNTTLSMDFAIRNSDGAMLVDLPAMTLGGGDREYPVNESILVNTTAQAFGDAVFNASLMVSLFPYAPNF